MSKNKVKEVKSKVVGSIEETAGKLTNDSRLEMKGKARQGVGKAYKIADDYIHGAEDLKDTVVGTVKEKTGQLTHDKPLELRGRLQKENVGNRLLKKFVYGIGILTLVIFIVSFINMNENE